MKNKTSLSQEAINHLWPRRSSHIYFMSHFKNEVHSAERLLRSVLAVPNVLKAVILLDDTTTDNTELVLFRLQQEFGSRIAYRRFTFQNNFALAKNECLLYAIENGMEQGDWCWVLGGDMSVPRKSAFKISEFTLNRNSVVARFDVPEFHPLKNHRYLWPFFFWMKTRTRPRLLLWRHRPDIDWDHFQFVHENMFPSFYRLTKMGDFFAKDQGIASICKIIHHGQHEDSESEARYKTFKYAVLWQCWRLVQLYGLTGGYEVILSNLMASICRDDLDRRASSRGWNFFIEYLTRRYMSGHAPEGLLPLYNATMASDRVFWSEYA